jgi:hydroxyquinol 1,2-dioxygenase
MRSFTESNLTAAVLARLEGADDPRFKEIMTRLVEHLHAFVREARLTEAEWLAAIRFLTATGQKCDATRQEYILLSDTLGVSMLVDAIQHHKQAGATESTVLGPFYVPGAPTVPMWTDLGAGAAGVPTFVSGRVLGVDGAPVRDASLDVWQTDGEGLYDVQRSSGTSCSRGRFVTGPDGRYGIRTVKPASYPIPTDGPVGQMLLAMGRHPFRPAHVHLIVSAPGHQPVTTHLFVAGDSYLDSDAVFAVKDSLIVDFLSHPAGPTPDGRTSSVPFCTADYDFKLVTAR